MVTGNNHRRSNVNAVLGHMIHQEKYRIEIVVILIDPLFDSGFEDLLKILRKQHLATFLL